MKDPKKSDFAAFFAVAVSIPLFLLLTYALWAGG
jgi:hypothetical protein